MTLSDADRALLRSQVAVKKEQLEAAPLSVGVVPIVIRCQWSSCRHGRHSLDHFHKGGRSVNYPVGFCQDCGAKITDLPEQGETMPFDDEQFYGSFAKFPKELIRAHYWTVPIDLYAHNQALRLGRKKLEEKVRKKVFESMLVNDRFKNQRAPWNAEIVAYAQHATATCCRECASYWHGLPRDMNVRPTDQQLKYVVALAHAYLELRLPGLPEEPTAGIPGIPTGAGPDEGERAEMEDLLIASFHHDVDPSGLVLPARSSLKLLAGSGPSGGYVTPSLVPLLHPGAA